MQPENTPFVAHHGFSRNASATYASRFQVVASLPFAPDIVLPTIEHFISALQLKASNLYGFKATFNSTYPGIAGSPCGWVSPWHYGLNQGPIVLTIENYRSELMWRLTQRSPYIVTGLRKAGFTGGWIEAHD